MNNALTPLGDLPGGNFLSEARAVNAGGQIVGNGNGAGATVYNIPQAILWQLDDFGNYAMQGLGFLASAPYAYSYAHDINDNGQIVGYSSSTLGQQAFIWQDNSMTGLGFLPSPTPFSDASAINAAGEVVGRSNNSSATEAFIWEKASGMRNLNSLLDSSGDDWLLIAANDINNHGQIVGYGRNPQGVHEAFLLDPTYLITARAGDGGKITPSGEVFVTYNADQAFSIDPYPNYRIADVKIDNASIGAVSSYTFENVAAAHTIDASFAGYAAVTVVAPNGGEFMASGSVFTVTWGAPATAVRFDLLYSLNNGKAWTSIVKGAVGYSYDWTPLPISNGTQCKVKVIGYNSAGKIVGNDVSDGTFAIEVIRVTAPNGGEKFSRAVTPSTRITWTTNGTSQAVTKVSLSYATDGGTKWSKIKDLTANPGYFDWSLPFINSSKYRVKVELFNGGGSLGADSSNASFTVGP